MKKLFGNFNLTWKRLIIFSIIVGVCTAGIAIIPELEYTSLHTIVVTMEVWILIGIFIIMNSNSNKDSALKCFVFFLLSQPLVYLLQVPFSWQGWALFKYYKYWFVWTILCLPMGYIGYYIKKGKWWGYLILLPMIILTCYSYYEYLTKFTFCYPYYSLISIYCILVMIMYPNVLFNNKKIKIWGTSISVLLIIITTILVLKNPYKYSTDIIDLNGRKISGEYQVYLEDKKYGDVSVEYLDTLEDYVIHAEFKKQGKTKLIVKDTNGEVYKYNIEIKMDTYSIK